MSQASETARRPAAADHAAPAGGEAGYRPPYLAAALATVLVFVLYAVTLGPTTWFWDTSEYITTAHMMGIPHPPGNPVFVMLARAWELLLAPTGLPTAVRINLFSAFMSAATAGFWYLVSHRILVAFSDNEWVRRIGAAVAVLISATTYTVWSQATVNEKVYTVSLFTIAALSWLAFLWRDHVEAHRGTKGPSRWHDDNVLVLMAFVLALSVGNHLMAFLAAPALFVFILLVRPRSLLRWKTWGYALVFAVLGLSANLFLPLRSGLNPIINEAEPTCPTVGGAMVSIVTFGKAGCPNLSASLAREQYGKPSMFSNPIAAAMGRDEPRGMKLLTQQLTNYMQYFDWQWARSVQGAMPYFSFGRLPFTLLFLGLGIYGAFLHKQRDRTSFWYMATLVFTLAFGLTFYLNFKHGYGQVRALNLPDSMAEVRERDYFFLVSFSLWGLWSGIGLTGLWQLLMDGREHERGRRLLSAPILALALIPLIFNWPYASRAGDYSARDWAYNLLNSVEPYGVLFTNGDNDTFPLWYAQEVEGVRRDVTVIVLAYLNTDWYTRQLRQLTAPCQGGPDAWKADETRNLCQRTFQPDAKTGFYGTPAKPTRSIIGLRDEEIRRIAGTYAQPLMADYEYQARGVTAQLRAGTYIDPADNFVLHIVQQAWGDRPIYFAATTGVHEKLGLFPHVARQGLAFKLVTPAEAQGMVRMPGDSEYSRIFGAYLDLERTRRLTNQVFEYRDLASRAHWTDDATRGIPTYYYYNYIALAQAELAAGNQKVADEYAEKAKPWMDLAER